MAGAVEERCRPAYRYGEPRSFGNVVLSAHNDIFRNLPHLIVAPGDLVAVHEPERYTYIVIDTQIVALIISK
jgi:sortase (surface protein transpeptidase)